MPQIIVSGAQIQCDKGATPSQLTVTSQQLVKAEEKLIATEPDKQPNTNIMPFGICSITQKACSPLPIAWQHTSPFTVESLHELTTQSTCPCTAGGTIRFIDSGHSNFITHS